MILEVISGGINMKKAKSNEITPGEVTFLLIGSMVGVGILIA